jgi:coenzyme F420-reducing hydrogenase alpha subunit
VSEPLSPSNRDAILAGIPEALKIVEHTLDWYKSIRENFREEITTFGNFPTLFMAIVKADGGLTFYDGRVAIVDAGGKVVASASNRSAIPSTSEKRSSPGAISNPPITSRRAAPMASTAWARWRG